MMGVVSGGLNTACLSCEWRLRRTETKGLLNTAESIEHGVKDLRDVTEGYSHEEGE